MELIVYFVALLAGFFGGIVGSISGGGSLISITALLLLGLPPYQAIATSKFASPGIWLSASYKYWKNKKVEWRLVPLLFAIYAVFGFIGASTLLTVDEELLSNSVGVVLLVLLAFIVFKPQIGVKKHKPKHVWLGYVLMAGVAFWAGFFGPGYGTLATYVLVGIFGLQFLNATGTNFFSLTGLIFTSVIVFALAGVIVYDVGLAMMLGYFLGGYVGSTIAIKKGNAWVRLIFIVFVLIGAIKILFF